MNNKMDKFITLGLLFLALEGLGVGGTLTVTTTPAATAATDGSKYLAINKTSAASPGVSFSSTNTTSHGSVTGWSWTFPQGTPPNSTSQNPGAVTFGTGAYGLSNSCTVGVTHKGSNGETCASSSKVVSTVRVNVVKPALAIGASWSGTDGTQLASRVGASSLTCGHVNEWTTSGVTQIGFAYEYIVTLAPVNSGAVKTDSDVEEMENITTQYFKSDGTEDTAHEPTPIVQTNYYRAGTGPGGAGCYSDSTVTAPANPSMYAGDIPKGEETDTDDLLNSYGDTREVVTYALSSYPLYQHQDPYDNPTDTSLKVTQTFVLKHTVGGSFSMTKS